MEDFAYLILGRYFVDKEGFSITEFKAEAKTHPEFVKFDPVHMPQIITAFFTRGFLEPVVSDADSGSRLKISELGKIAFEVEKSHREDLTKMEDLQGQLNTSVIVTNKWMRIFTGIVAIASFLTFVVTVGQLILLVNASTPDPIPQLRSISGSLDSIRSSVKGVGPAPKHEEPLDTPRKTK